jgi:hypothetical protein
MDKIRIPNPATYFPMALSDISMVAPIASRLLLGATLPGRMVQAAAVGAYFGSALVDWMSRVDARRIDFLETFGSDVHHLTATPKKEREKNVKELTGRLNDLYTPMDVPRRELAKQVDDHLTDYIAGITGQRVETSQEVRDFMIASLIFPFALGAADPLTGDVAIFKDTGVFEPHVITHEFAHRKGYYKELEAQALAYLALADSGDDVLVQSALCERLDRQLWVLADNDAARYKELLEDTGLRSELAHQFGARRGVPLLYERVVGSVVREMYDLRMQVTGQNGISDYDEGFTDFLYTMESAGQPSGTRARPKG